MALQNAILQKCAIAEVTSGERRGGSAAGQVEAVAPVPAAVRAGKMAVVAERAIAARPDSRSHGRGRTVCAGWVNEWPRGD